MGRPDGKNLQILDLHRLASLEMGKYWENGFGKYRIYPNLREN